MKRRIVIIMVLGMANSALGLNYLGPPTTRLRTGQWYVGASYSDSRQDIEFSADDTDTDIKDWDQSSTLGRIGVGLADNILEIFGLVGMTELEQGESPYLFQTDDELLLGGGFRATMYMGEGNNLDWGIAGQVTYTKFEGDSVVLKTRTDYELSALEFLVGIGPCWRPDPWLLYGGLLVHFITGDIDTTRVGSYDISQESAAGIYMGGGVELAKHVMLTAEGQATPDSYGWAIAAGYEF
jgi:hypothetical protein